MKCTNWSCPSNRPNAPQAELREMTDPELLAYLSQPGIVKVSRRDDVIGMHCDTCGREFTIDGSVTDASQKPKTK